MKRPEYDPKTIGKNLRRLRVANGYKVEDIREYLGLGCPQAVYKYESGLSYPQADSLIALMQLYNVSWDELIREQGEDVRILCGGIKERILASWVNLRKRL